MMMGKKHFIDEIQETRVAPGTLAIFYLGQAGFWFKTASGKNFAIDVYLSDAAERLFGFKRMCPRVIEPEDLDVDLYLTTHSHIDHLDLDMLPAVVAKESVYFIGASDCESEYKNLGLTSDRYTILKEGESCLYSGISVRAIYADHGDLALDAVGFLIEVDGITIYHTGDTSFCPERIIQSLQTKPNIMIAPINGAYGNLNAPEACQLATFVRPQLLLASHFWTFCEHVGAGGLGDPAVFIQEGKNLPHEIEAVVLPPGRQFIFPTDIARISK